MTDQYDATALTRAEMEAEEEAWSLSAMTMPWTRPRGASPDGEEVVEEPAT